MHVLTRDPKPNSSKNTQFFKCDMDRGFIDEKVFEGVTVIINLTGANIGEKRWTAQRKKEIIHSRIKFIELLYDYVSQNKFNSL